MPQQSSETRPVPPTAHPLDDGPVLECAALAGEAGDQSLRIHARRVYPVTRDEVFAAWTRRTAWDSWMRLRARSRATLSPYRGGAFRLELAEGPTIHVITGMVNELRSPEFLSLGWVRQGRCDHASVIDVWIRDRHGLAEMTLIHGHIASRREASWLMRLWTTVLDRFGGYIAEGAMPVTRRRSEMTGTIAHTNGPETRRPGIRTTFARSA